MYISHNNTGENEKISGDDLGMKNIHTTLSFVLRTLSTPLVGFGFEKIQQIQGGRGFPHINKSN
jgi:hypothetical protein